MGCYDTVLFLCPHCKARNEYQSKAGDCNLQTYDMNEVPAAIADEMDRWSIACESCSKAIKFKNITPTACTVIAYDPDEPTEPEWSIVALASIVSLKDGLKDDDDAL